tara:strand:+ start:613 stop:1248 length:636 start_codon:yes stop_codon:yes gene_type:complete
MAANEHKNLSDINRHNPKGFENATNDTVLSKNSGSSATGTDGNLAWIPKNILKISNVRFMGTSTFGSTNYFLHRDVGNNIEGKLSIDYGSATATTATPQQALRYGRYVSTDACNLTRFTGIVTNTTSDVCNLTLWKVTPVDDSSAALAITVLKEVSITGSGNNAVRTFDVDMTAEANNTLLKGDIIIPVVKNDDTSATMFFSSTLSLSYDN